MLKKLGVILTTIALMGVAKADCPTLLKKCDSALNSYVELSQLQKTIIEDQKTLLSKKDDLIKNQQTRLNSPLSNPWVTIPVSLLLGALLIKAID